MIPFNADIFDLMGIIAAGSEKCGICNEPITSFEGIELVSFPLVLDKVLMHRACIAEAERRQAERP